MVFFDVEVCQFIIDEQDKLSDVVKVGDKVFFNAEFGTEGAKCQWKATKVWLSRESTTPYAGKLHSTINKKNVGANPLDPDLASLSVNNCKTVEKPTYNSAKVISKERVNNITIKQAKKQVSQHLVNILMVKGPLEMHGLSGHVNQAPVAAQKMLKAEGISPEEHIRRQNHIFHIDPNTCVVSVQEPKAVHQKTKSTAQAQNMPVLDIKAVNQKTKSTADAQNMPVLDAKAVHQNTKSTANAQNMLVLDAKAVHQKTKSTAHAHTMPVLDVKAVHQKTKSTADAQNMPVLYVKAVHQKTKSTAHAQNMPVIDVKAVQQKTKSTAHAQNMSVLDVKAVHQKTKSTAHAQNMPVVDVKAVHQKTKYTADAQNMLVLDGKAVHQKTKYTAHAQNMPVLDVKAVHQKTKSTAHAQNMSVLDVKAVHQKTKSAAHAQNMPVLSSELTIANCYVDETRMHNNTGNKQNKYRNNSNDYKDLQHGEPRTTFESTKAMGCTTFHQHHTETNLQCAKGVPTSKLSESNEHMFRKSDQDIINVEIMKSDEFNIDVFTNHGVSTPDIINKVFIKPHKRAKQILTNPEMPISSTVTDATGQISVQSGCYIPHTRDAACQTDGVCLDMCVQACQTENIKLVRHVIVQTHSTGHIMSSNMYQS